MSRAQGNGSRTPRIIIAALTAAIAARVALVWDSLPPVMASHFGADGAPNGWMSRGSFFGTMAVVCGGAVGLLVALPLLFDKIPPSLINLPNREYWLADGRREEALGRIAGKMTWFAVATTALLVLVIELSLEANLARTGLDNGVFLVGLGAYFVAVVASIVSLHRSFRIPGTASR